MTPEEFAVEVPHDDDPHRWVEKCPGCGQRAVYEAMAPLNENGASRGKMTCCGAVVQVNSRRGGAARVAEKIATNNRFHIRKVDDDRRLVFGWASVAVSKDGKPVLDLQNDLIDPQDLENAAYGFVLLRGDANEMHTDASVGQLVESLFVSPEKLEKMGLPVDALPQGWWIGFYIEDPAVFQKVKAGEYRAFSIEGTATRSEAFA
jgi:hypothetical protein